MHRYFSVGLILATLAPLPSAISAQSADKALIGKHATKHFDLRFVPGSRAAASVDRTAVLAERDLADMCKKLDFTPKGRFVLYLYDSVQELAAITRTGGNAGFSAGNASHIPYDNDQTRYHEMVHIVAYKLPRVGKEPRSLFFAEGLANALLEFVHGVHVHAVAAFYLREKRLPPLVRMTRPRNFYAWLRKHPGFNAYDVAASWFRFLIDSEGIAKVKRYYTGVTAKKAFGKSEAKLEKEWRSTLTDYELRPAVVTLLEKRDGQPAKFAVYLRDPDSRLPKDLRSTASGWVSVLTEKLDPATAKQWSRRGKHVHGTAKTNDWEVCRLGSNKQAAVAVNATIRPQKATVGVQVRLGSRCQLMLTNAGMFLFGKGLVAQDRSERITGRKKVELLLVRRGKRVVGYVDGCKVVEADLDMTSAVPAIGVAGGGAVFESVRVRQLK